MRTVRFERLDALEGRLCLPCNQFARFALVRAYFQLVSRLGDGVIWYALLAALPAVYGPPSFAPTAHLAITALIAVTVYKVLKKNLLRERPFASHAAVEAITRPLDRYSFPSGHTLHAVSLTILYGSYEPALLIVMVPFALLVAASRIVLGLHYPSDVIAGTAIGAVIGTTAVALAG